MLVKVEPVILIIDGKNLCYRARHKFSLTYRGVDTSILYGFLRMVYAVMNKYAPEVVVICWDHGVPAYRKQVCPEYKDNRAKHDDDLGYVDFIEQVRELETVLGSFGFCSVGRRNCEGDDLMYHASRLLGGHRVIVTSDQDLFQAVGEHVTLYSHTKDMEVTPDNFRVVTEGVSQNDWMAYRLLVGDSGDNVAGVFGVGPKTAIKILYDIDLVDLLGGNFYLLKSANDKIRKAIQEHGTAGFCKAMECMDLSLDIAGARRQLLMAFKAWQPMDRDYVVRWLKSLMFVSLMEPAFYEVLERLRSPMDLLVYNSHLRFPVVAPDRTPVEKDSDE